MTISYSQTLKHSMAHLRHKYKLSYTQKEPTHQIVGSFLLEILFSGVMHSLLYAIAMGRFPVTIEVDQH